MKKVMSFLLTGVLAIVIIYYAREFWLINQAETAYQNKDCEKALKIGAIIHQQYPLSITSYINPTTVWMEVCQTFLSAQTKRDSKDWQGASEDFAKLLKIGEERKTPLDQIVQASLTESRLSLAEEQYTAGEYESAIQTYRLVDVKDNTIKKEVESKIIQTYLDWIMFLKQHGEIQHAEDLLVDLWNSDTLNHIQAIEVGLTEDDLTKALGRSSGVVAQELMNDALLKACNSQPSDSIAIANSGTHKAMIFINKEVKRDTSMNLDEQKKVANIIDAINIPLPKEWHATTPAEFYYAICITIRVDRFKNVFDMFDRGCSYGSSGSYTIERKQIFWDIEIRDTRTATPITVVEVSGEKPPDCPDKVYSDGRNALSFIGNSPSDSKVITSIVKALEGVE